MAHITFIHGIANKPPKDKLNDIWLRALANNDGIDLDGDGVTYEMVYWADMLYAKPDHGSQSQESLESDGESILDSDEEDESWQENLSQAEKAFVNRMADTLDYKQAPPSGDDEFEAPAPSDTDANANRFERIPLPWFIKRRVMKALLKDVHHYLFNATTEPRPGEIFKVQTDIRKRFVDSIKSGNQKPGPHIVISHSMGTVIAYDCLKRVTDCPSVDALMTIGSPLGLDEVQDKLGEDPLPKWTRNDGYPSVNVNSRWINIYDHLDPVCGFDPKFANDFRQSGNEVVKDINEQNYGKWRHSIHKYLSQPKLQIELKKLFA